MRTGLLMETAIAREAALNANRADIEAMQRCLKASRAARTWRQYETSDNQLHQLIAEATHNNLLVALYDALNSVRRTIVWGRMRTSDGGPRPIITALPTMSVSSRPYATATSTARAGPPRRRSVSYLLRSHILFVT